LLGGVLDGERALDIESVSSSLLKNGGLHIVKW
jgi:hypothetical protein